MFFLPSRPWRSPSSTARVLFFPLRSPSSFILMASSGGIGALNAVRVADMEAMSVDQLRPLKEQTDLEVNLQGSHNNIMTASTRLDIASTALHDLFLRHQGIYLPPLLFLPPYAGSWIANFVFMCPFPADRRLNFSSRGYLDS
ncbi:putative prefoldin subunit 5 [Platanthera guangdongensis]|uniref:Prefoldin subunit 5 n=1 Tax=Platanthera guangdongensis TaxID=2320717 RepID=A0ABR2MR56_9ASPA